MSDALLSVVLPADRYPTIRPVIDRLQQQTARDKIEIVLVMPSEETGCIEQADLAMFASVRIATVGSSSAMGARRAAGVSQAQADLVCLGETHSFPHPGWAEALIQASDRSRTVIVPAIGNANPDTAASWAAFLSDYGAWFEGQTAGEIGAAPTFNVVYQRSFLLGFGDRLETALSHSDEIAVSLRRLGHRIHFEPAARSDHLNVSTMTGYLGERFHGGRLIGASRGARWSWTRRLAYACGSPLIPLVLLWRTARGFRLAARHSPMPAGTIPVTILGTCTKAFGECLGYVGGRGSIAGPRMDDYELHKVAFTREGKVPGLEPCLQENRGAHTPGH